MTGWVMGGCDDTGCMASGSFSPIMLSPICILAVLGRGIWRAGALCHASLGPSTCLDLAQSRCSTCILTAQQYTILPIPSYVRNQKPGRKCFWCVNWGPLKRQSLARWHTWQMSLLPKGMA